MKHIVYMIINKVNGKIYIGKHSTSNVNDNYFGSGKALKAAIKKYGIENFTKEIIAVFDNETDAFILENNIVNENFISRKDTYNISIGGKGNNKFGYYDSKEDKYYQHAMKCDKIKNKVKNTNIEKYGCEYVLQNIVIRQKGKDTMIAKYGVESSLMIPENKEKASKALILKYGSSSPLQNKEIKQKYDSTMIDKYGVNVPLKNKNIKEKYDKTIKEKYGVSHIMHDNSIKEKASNNRRKYIWINDGKINKKIHKDLDLPLGFVLGKLKSPKNASVAALNRPKKQCPLCKKNIDSSNYQRHLNKCIRLFHTSVPDYQSNNSIN